MIDHGLSRTRPIDPNFDPVKTIDQVSDQTLDPIVATCTAFLAQAEFS